VSRGSEIKETCVGEVLGGGLLLGRGKRRKPQLRSHVQIVGEGTLCLKSPGNHDKLFSAPGDERPELQFSVKNG